MSKHTSLNYQEDIKIDKYHLDTCWEEQQELSIKYSELSVDANKQKEQSELNVEIIEEDLKTILANLVLEVKFNYRDYNFEKPPSDSAANAWAITQDKYKEKQQELREVRKEAIEARDLAFRLRNVAREFSERRFSLQELTKLFLNGYYSESGRDIREQANNIIEENQGVKTAKSLNNKLNDSMERRNVKTNRTK